MYPRCKKPSPRAPPLLVIQNAPALFICLPSSCCSFVGSIITTYFHNCLQLVDSMQSNRSSIFFITQLHKPLWPPVGSKPLLDQHPCTAFSPQPPPRHVAGAASLYADAPHSPPRVPMPNGGKSIRHNPGCCAPYSRPARLHADNRTMFRFGE